LLNGAPEETPFKTTITLSTETEHAVIYYTSDGSPLTTLTSANRMKESHGIITLDPSTVQTLDIYAMAVGPSMLPSTVVHAVVSVSPYPVLSITRQGTATEDGETATFIITSSRAPATDITVNLLTGGNYAAGDVAGFYPAGTHFTTKLYASTTTVSIPITGQPDFDVVDDTVTLTIEPDTINSPPTYSVAGAANAQAQIVIVDNKVAKYTVTYNGNGAGGVAPTDAKTYLQGDTVTAAGRGTLSRFAYHFGGWNTQADGTGTNYTAGEQFTMGNGNLTLYAHWLPGIEKTAGTGIRLIGGNLLLLTFLAVKAGTEDQSALEYDLTGFSYPVSSATLDIYIDNLDPGPPDGVMDFYTYEGDGVIDTSEFYAGSLYAQVTSTDDSFTHVDFKAAVNAALQNGWTYLGVRISTVTADRYWIDGAITGSGFPEPILTVVQ
jgi:uncharacterized repeat protein (TIGR02543 family)